MRHPPSLQHDSIFPILFLLNFIADFFFFRPVKVGTWPTLRRYNYSLLSSLRPKRTESLKPVLTQSHSLVFFRNILHIFPTLICLALIALNTQSLYMNSHKAWVPLLQYAAKVHELLIQASIATVALDYIRYELIREENVPFGAIFPAISTGSVASLWSGELWAVRSANCLDGRKKAKFFALITFCTLLATVAGPASAIAMVPRNVNFPLGRTITTFNASANDLFPTSISGAKINRNCSSSLVALYSTYRDCPASNTQVLNRWLATPYFTPVYSSQSLANLLHVRPIELARYFIEDGENMTDYSSMQAISTIEPFTQTRALATSANIWWSNTDVLSDTETLTTKAVLQKPLVHADCKDGWFNQTVSGRNLTFGTGGWRASPSIEAIMRNITWRNIGRGGIIWVEPEQSISSNVSILAIIVQPRTSTADAPIQDSLCAVKAWWTNTEVELRNTYDQSTRGSLSFPREVDLVNLWLSMMDSPTISLAPAWAKYLIPSGQPVPTAAEWRAAVDSNKFLQQTDPTSYLVNLVTMGLANYVRTPTNPLDPRPINPYLTYDPIIVMDDTETLYQSMNTIEFFDVPRS